MQDLRSKVADILEVETVGDDDVLIEFEYWDSLTVIAIQAMLDSDYGVNITAADLLPVSTFSDLAALVAARGDE